MHRIKRLRPSASMVVALIALFAATAGTETAARLITGSMIKNSSITTADVKNSSLLSSDFKPGQLPAGAQGPTGPAGAKGDKGETGAAGADGADGGPGMSGYERILSRDPGPSATSDTYKTRDVSCPAGKKVIAGSNDRDSIELGDSSSREVAVAQSRPLDDDTWRVQTVEVVETSDTRWLDVVIVCVDVESAVPAAIVGGRQR